MDNKSQLLIESYETAINARSNELLNQLKKSTDGHHFLLEELDQLGKEWALLYLLKYTKNTLPPLDNGFQKAYRSYDVNSDGNLNSAIYSLLNCVSIFWNVFSKLIREK